MKPRAFAGAVGLLAALALATSTPLSGMPQPAATAVASNSAEAQLMAEIYAETDRPAQATSEREAADRLSKNP